SKVKHFINKTYLITIFTFPNYLTNRPFNGTTLLSLDNFPPFISDVLFLFTLKTTAISFFEIASFMGTFLHGIFRITIQ
ncbi:hypothetical protein AB3N02_27055, partial [Priestia aryabhattai]|uniref:hypothetical protein n=1 Tax=Priestia aryabhattai TaxID=412384 RepID=UPI0039A17A7C